MQTVITRTVKLHLASKNFKNVLKAGAGLIKGEGGWMGLDSGVHTLVRKVDMTSNYCSKVTQRRDICGVVWHCGFGKSRSVRNSTFCLKLKPLIDFCHIFMKY